MKLRQKIALSLCTFYLVSVIGIALSLHFCGGNLADVQFSAREHCKGCKAAEKQDTGKDCCKNTAVDARIKDSHESGSKVSVPKNYGFTLFLAPFLSEMIRTVLPGLFSRKAEEAPPLSSRVSLYVYHCVFRN